MLTSVSNDKIILSFLQETECFSAY